MKQHLHASALALFLCAAAPAHAQFVSAAPQSGNTLIAPVSGHTYFNRPGATPEQQRADLEACHTAVFAMVQPVGESSGAGAAYGLVGALLEVGFQIEAQQLAQRRAHFSHYESCMVMRGWRVVRLNETLGAELDALDQASLAPRLAPMIGAETPEGEIARVFANEAADGAAALFGIPQIGDAESLSLQALPADSPAFLAPPPTAAERNAGRRRPGSGPDTREEYEARRAAREGDPEQVQARRETHERALAQLVGPGEAARNTRPRDIARLPDNSTLIVVRMAGLGYGSGVMLMRPGAQEGTVDFVTAVVPTAFISGPKEQTVVAVVPPGHWRLSGFVGPGGYITSFCMGAPSFEVAEGDVVFAGSFAFGATGERLDMTLDPARAALANAPNLAARLRSADYRNGETFECGAASNFYTYEIADAPFADGYTFGSRANAAPTAIASEAAETAPAVTEPAVAPAPPPEPEATPGE